MATRSCECGCGRDFTFVEGSRGQPRKYFSTACRKRAQRNRETNRRWIKAIEGELHVQSDPPTKQLANAIAETSVCAAAFRRLAIEEANAVLAAGAERMYLEIIAALDRNFPGMVRMSKGRIPKPDEDRAGHRPGVGQGESVEVIPVESRLLKTRAPADLSPLAAEVWEICIADMTALGHLREPDMLQVRNYAVEVAIAIECEAVIAEFGAVMKEPILAWSEDLQANEVVGWKLKTNVACELHRKAANAVRLMANDLALTPIARIRGNLMSAVTASVALSIKEDLERDAMAEEKRVRAAARRKKPAAKTKPKPKTPPTRKTTPKTK